MSVGKSIPRVDAYQKVTGRAKYTDDLLPTNHLVAKLVRSTIANGVVKSFDLSEAEKVPGVVKILTCFDAPAHSFPTAGHPWSIEKAHQDVADRRLLNTRVRIYGDDIAVVIAEDEVSAARAARLVKVEYEEYAPLVNPEAALASEDEPIQEDFAGNVLKRSVVALGGVPFEKAAGGDNITCVCGSYDTQMVQHSHLELPVSHAWMENGRVTVVSSTQIPHIVKRVICQATGLPFGKVRVVKPYIGGGFGNKQEVLYEPLNAWLTTQVGGRCVKLEISREETMFGTRTRHAIHFDLETAVNADGRLIARKGKAVSMQGGYASHGHAIVANSANEYHMMYQDELAHNFEAVTVYTNAPAGGAMRGYGIPQMVFAMESHMDDIALKLGIDPIELRLKNCMPLGFVDEGTGITSFTNGLRECVEKGKQFIKWDEKRAEYKNQTGDVRRGVGMAIFCYKTGVYPISLETASARIILNQDGTVQVQMGATEIGQGADTVFTQMAAEIIGIPWQNVNIVSTQDTDITPFDTGAYASRQTYVSGMALKKAGMLFKQKVLDYAAEVLGRAAEDLDLRDAQIVENESGVCLRSLADVAMEAFYSLSHSQHITAEVTHHCTDNTFAFGACFAEVEVDIPVGKIKVLNIINVHDSGELINPQLAEAQVHGGMSMALGFGLLEELLINKDGRILNDNFLDYKLPTSMDTPELHAQFVETKDPTGPFNNKALGEPPAIPGAAALRNAVLNATGVAINSLPLNAQKLVAAFTKAGLIKSVGGDENV